MRRCSLRSLLFVVFLTCRDRDRELIRFARTYRVIAQHLIGRTRFVQRLPWWSALVCLAGQHSSAVLPFFREPWHFGRYAGKVRSGKYNVRMKAFLAPWRGVKIFSDALLLVHPVQVRL